MQRKCNHAQRYPTIKLNKPKQLLAQANMRLRPGTAAETLASSLHHQRAASLLLYQARQQSALLLLLMTQHPRPSSRRQRPHAAARCLAPVQTQYATSAHTMRHEK
jgi:hypothetical protein